MKVIGITGRSGCGKSTVTAYLREQGLQGIDADQVSREVLLPGSPCLEQLKNSFGSDIVNEQGVLNRRLLADRAFATPEGTRRLTQITHPEILRRIHQAVETARRAGEKFFFVDGAVIVGTPFQACCDRLVVVTAPYEQSVARICARDGITPEMARRRLDAQMSEAELLASADARLVNDSTPQALQQQCRRLLEALRKEENG